MHSGFQGLPYLVACIDAGCAQDALVVFHIPCAYHLVDVETHRALGGAAFTIDAFKADWESASLLFLRPMNLVIIV